MSTATVKTVRKTKTVKTDKKVAAHARTKTLLYQGVYVNPSRVKSYLDDNTLNYDITVATNELLAAEAHDVVNPTTKEVTHVPFVPFGKLSQATQDLVKRARDLHDQRERENAERAAKAAQALADDILTGRKTQEQVDRANAEKSAKEQKNREDKEAREADRRAKGELVRNPKAHTEHSESIELLSKMRTRFSKLTPVYISALMDLFAHELIEFGMNNVIANKRKIVTPHYCLMKGYENLSLSSLYRDLDVFKRALVEDEANQRFEAELAAAKKAEKKARAAAEASAAAAAAAAAKAVVPGTKAPSALSNPVAKVAPVTQPHVVVVQRPVFQPQPHGVANGPAAFEHYVKQVCYNIINEKLVGQSAPNKSPYANLRISDDLKRFVSNLLIAFIKKLAPLLKSELNIIGVRTIKLPVVQHVVNQMLEILGINSAKVNSDVDAKMTTYHNAILERKNAQTGESGSSTAPVDDGEFDDSAHPTDPEPHDPNDGEGECDEVDECEDEEEPLPAAAQPTA